MRDWVKTKSDEVAWDEGCRPNRKAAERVRRFFETFLRHSKGDWSQQPFELLPWQWEDIVKPLYGWMRPDGRRRFRRAYIEVPKKNGKSTLCAGLVLYHLIADREDGAEVYCAASDKRQASIIYQETLSMVNKSPELSGIIRKTPSKKRLDLDDNASFFEALSADVKTKEGFNISALIFDELHAQPDRKLWDTLRYGGAARAQPMSISITTAGYDRTSICWEQHVYAEAILNGTHTDTSFHGVIYSASPEDDWKSPATWAKANPSYGVSIREDDLREACKEAELSPLAENAFKRYRLNLWTEQETRWLPVELWDKCDGPVETEGECYVGVDLASRHDLASVCYFFPKSLSAVWKYYVPEDTCRERERLNKTKLDLWVRQKWIVATPGDQIDQQRIRNDLNAVPYKIKQIAVDRYDATKISTELVEDGHVVIGFGQGYVSMSAPVKELETLIRGKVLRHGGNPVARWNFGNAAVEQDAAGNLKLSKKLAREKIDGLVALVMAIGLWIKSDRKKKSVYERRGVTHV